MDTNNLNNGSGLTNGVDKPIQRPVGVRPSGSRPSGLRPSGVNPSQQVTRPASQQVTRPASQTGSVRPSGVNPSQQVTRPASQTGSVRPSVVTTNQQVTRPASQTGSRPSVVTTNQQATRTTSTTGAQGTQRTQGTQSQINKQPETANKQPETANKQPETANKQPETAKEHIMKSTGHQRVIDSKHIEFTKDPNKKDYVLYMIIDKPVDGMLQYFRSYGLNVSKIFGNIDDARNALMMQVNPARIVIVDTGNGSFNSMSARKQVIDIIGLGDDENKVTIFYSDTNLKYEIEASKEIQKKALTWYKYKTTAHLLACMLQSKDCNYISDGGYSDASPIVSNLDETLWRNINFKDAEEHGLLPMINSTDINKLVHDENAEVIEGFNPIIR